MAGAKLNPITGKIDMVGMTATEIAAYLKLDQTTHQHVINDAPRFDGGIVLKSGQKLIFDGA
jgi:hypothetical protein